METTRNCHSTLNPLSVRRTADARLYDVERRRFLSEHPYCQLWLSEHGIDEELAIRNQGNVRLPRQLAKVGYERLQEIENPEMAARRIKEIYRQKGYSEAWIEKRMRGIAVRDELTDEWKKRGVKEDREYSILTAEISKATFGMTPTQYREHKALSDPTDNLRDHMSDLELIFTMLGEASTTEIARKIDAQ